MFCRIIIVTSIFLSLLIYHKTEAATLEFGSNGVVGIQNVLISGVYYDVDFILNSYTAIWGTDFDFYTSADAEQATIQIDNALKDYDPMPTLIQDDSKTSPTYTNYFRVPYSVHDAADETIDYWSGRYDSPWHTSGPWWGYMWYEDGMFAKLSPSVPIPSAVWLLGSGLIGIVGIRRKFRK